MCACGPHFDTRFVRSVFCDAHVAAENLLYLFFRCGEKTLRGFVYSLNRRDNAKAVGFLLFILFQSDGKSVEQICRRAQAESKGQ